ncbi:MAG TPA: CRTAC1 family protein [Terriglobales bacterium]|nr:CRTAC1 family protein [Terriglobales bacterium]
MMLVSRTRIFWLVFALQMVIQCFAQGGHDVAPPLPPGLKNKVCRDRPVPQLEDVASAAGITFRHSYSPEKKYIPESMSGGVMLIDFDRDGWPDIYFTNAPTVDMALKHEKARGALYRNNHDGTFTDVSEKAGIASPCFANGGAVGDYNNDGWPDLYVTCLGANVLYRNNGDGTFTDVTAKAGVGDDRNSTGAAFGDYDNDGYIDLMVTNYVDFRLNSLPGFGKLPICTFRGLDVQCGPRGLKGAGDTLYHNNGDGTFADISKSAGVDDPPGYFGLGVTWVDFNNTGRPDLFIANDATPNYLYKNEGGGKFTEIGLESGTAVSQDGTEQACMGVAIGDYLHNGLPSIYVTNFENEYSTLYRNKGDWQFDELSYKSGVALPSMPFVKWGDAFVDLDNDGWLDLIAVSGHVYPQVATLPSGAGYQQPGMLQMNQKDGTFCDASQQAGATLMQKRTSRGLAVGDLFNDGRMDVVVEDIDGAPMILRNRGIAGQHWVSFELAGTRSNRLAIGARLKLTAAGMTQSDQIRSGGSYLSQSDFRVHFGLGSASQIESVEIHWPSGATDVLKNLAADQFYAVQEGKGVVPSEQIRPHTSAPR